MVRDVVQHGQARASKDHRSLPKPTHSTSAASFYRTCGVLRFRLQKEPKLDRARQIPEWSHYDAEIAQFARSLADKGLIKSDAAAGNIDKLASVGKKTESTEAAAEATSSVADEPPAETASESSSEEHVRDEL